MREIGEQKKNNNVVRQTRLISYANGHVELFNELVPTVPSVRVVCIWARMCARPYVSLTIRSSSLKPGTGPALPRYDRNRSSVPFRLASGVSCFQIIFTPQF